MNIITSLIHPYVLGTVISFNGKMRNELLNGDIFYSLSEAQVIIEMWRKHYNTVRPHSALGYRPPAPETPINMAWNKKYWIEKTTKISQTRSELIIIKVASPPRR